MDKDSILSETDIPSVKTILEMFEGQIKHCARTLVGHYNIPSHEVEDIEQELRLAIFKAYPAYCTERRPYGPYFQVVIDNARRRIIRYRKQRHLDKPVPPLLILEDIDDESDSRPHGIIQDCVAAPEKDFLGDIDAEIMAKGLQGVEREAFLILAADLETNVKGVAKMLGISRTTFRRNILPKIKAVLAQYGLATNRTEMDR